MNCTILTEVMTRSAGRKTNRRSQTNQPKRRDESSSIRPLIRDVFKPLSPLLLASNTLKIIPGLASDIDIAPRGLPYHPQNKLTHYLRTLNPIIAHSDESLVMTKIKPTVLDTMSLIFALTHFWESGFHQGTLRMVLIHQPLQSWSRKPN